MTPRDHVSAAVRWGLCSVLISALLADGFSVIRCGLWIVVSLLAAHHAGKAVAS